jgi:hypothetical protein
VNRSFKKDVSDFIKSVDEDHDGSLDDIYDFMFRNIYSYCDEYEDDDDEDGDVFKVLEGAMVRRKFIVFLKKVKIYKV